METGKPRRLRFSLGQDAAYDEGLICGGQLEVFIEPVEPQNRALIFGAGHISKSIARLTGLLGFHTSVVDNRESFANRERFPEADSVVAGEYEDVFPSLEVNSSSYVIIVTRGHRDDMRVLRWAVTTPARYIALIGSKRKVINVVKELEKEGVPRASFDRVFGPMGLDIGALTPEEIAVSVAAEIVAVRRNAVSNWRALSMSVFAHEETRALLS
jgi:xanthine dehydrogenase accessory factor